jgi:hypothetical protein
VDDIEKFSANFHPMVNLQLSKLWGVQASGSHQPSAPWGLPQVQGQWLSQNSLYPLTEQGSPTMATDEQ